MLLLVIYTVGFCTNALQISSKSIYYVLFISPIAKTDLMPSYSDWSYFEQPGPVLFVKEDTTIQNSIGLFRLT
jgi:hypothetical protein